VLADEPCGDLVEEVGLLADVLDGDGANGSPDE
jgi:hypothetical protein